MINVILHKYKNCERGSLGKSFEVELSYFPFEVDFPTSNRKSQGKYFHIVCESTNFSKGSVYKDLHFKIELKFEAQENLYEMKQYHTEFVCGCI